VGVRSPPRFTTEARKTTETATENRKDLVGVLFTLKQSSVAVSVVFRASVVKDAQPKDGGGPGFGANGSNAERTRRGREPTFRFRKPAGGILPRRLRLRREQPAWEQARGRDTDATDHPYHTRLSPQP
jgi:hypothetical protein